MTRAYELTDDGEVREIKRQSAEHDAMLAELWDAGDEYDELRDNPSRPLDSDLLPAVHIHHGCGHTCQEGCCAATARLRDPLCIDCVMSEQDVHERRQRPLRKHVVSEV